MTFSVFLCTVLVTLGPGPPQPAVIVRRHSGCNGRSPAPVGKQWTGNICIGYWPSAAGHGRSRWRQGEWQGTQGLTLLLLGGGGGGESASCGFSNLYQKAFSLAPWNSENFRNHLLGVLCENFDFLPCAESAPGTFLWRYFSLNFEVSDIFHQSAHCLGLQKLLINISRHFYEFTTM